LTKFSCFKKVCNTNITDIINNSIYVIKKNGSSPIPPPNSSLSTSHGINSHLKRNIAPAPPVPIAPLIPRQSGGKQYHQFTSSSCWNTHHHLPIAPKKSLPDQGLGNYAK
jgi:hypothetical protein